ncbi:MAG: selenide, water dikinase SelD [Burkholderiales bacterium]|nr:selenide, water dikinase SelD [Burkholderiales bacterium]
MRAARGTGAGLRPVARGVGGALRQSNFRFRTTAMSPASPVECAVPGAAPLRLTSFSHGGGCGCKIAPGVLSEILRSSVGGLVPRELMVGIETADDAAVWRLNDEQALIATTDFFMPIVDDPYDFGRIAATNAISDVYAMGGKPIMALALVAMPIDKLTVEQIGAVIRGGESVCREAGIPIAGGHTIDSVEPIYGLVVMGLVHPSKVRRNADAKAGDVLVLGKPIGVGVLSAALKKNALDPAGYAGLISTTTRLNTPGIALAAMPGVHAITDVTGFGLAGHALEMARGAKLGVTIAWSKVPLLEGVAQMAGDGFVTGASGRNWAGYGAEVELDPALPPIARDLLTDPQTSGGLLVSCDPASADAVLAVFRAQGFDAAAVVGEVCAGASGLRVTA